MKRNRLPPDDPREWLNRARSNLARAHSRIPEAYVEDYCFDAQQAAEKAIKAVFVCRAEKFPFIHDLDRLLGMLEKNGLKIPKYVREADELSPFAAGTRYPGEQDAVTPRQYRRALRIAAAVVRWAERQVEHTSPPD
jgi:HEPN domain-containing protein